MTLRPNLKKKAATYAAKDDAPSQGVDLLSAGAPRLVFPYTKFSRLSKRERLALIGKEFVSTNLAAFARGAVFHRLIDYAFDALAPNTKKAGIVRNTVHSAVNLYEMDSVLQSCLSIEDDSMQNEALDPDRAVIYWITHYVDKEFLGGTSKHSKIHLTGYTYGDISFDDLIATFTDLSPEIAERMHVSVLRKEVFESNGMSWYLFAVEISGSVVVFVLNRTQSSFEDRYINQHLRIHWRNDSAVSFEMPNESGITAVVRASILAKLQPEKHLIELDFLSSKFVSRRTAYKMLPNINLPEIEKSIASALSQKKRRVIALVGDAGLGKTEAMHSIVNLFPKLPVYIVTPSAAGTSATAIKSIFDAVKVVESIVVFDDFESFDVQRKGEVTSEFLRQLDGSSGFNGIAILIVNDPSKVHPLILNRPGRTDSVYLVDYLSKFEDIVGVIEQKYPHVHLTNEYRGAIQRMVELRFSTARMLRAVEVAQEHYSADGKLISPDDLIRGINKAEEFARVATATTVSGRLVFGSDAAKESCSDLGGICAPANVTCSSPGSRRVWEEDQDDCAGYGHDVS